MSPNVRQLPSPPPPNWSFTTVRRFGSVGGGSEPPAAKKDLRASRLGILGGAWSTAPRPVGRRRPPPNAGTPSREPEGRGGRRWRRGRGAAAAGERRRRWRRRARGAGRPPQLQPLPPRRSRMSRTAAAGCALPGGQPSPVRQHATPRVPPSVGCLRQLLQGFPAPLRSRVVRSGWGRGTRGAARPCRAPPSGRRGPHGWAGRSGTGEVKPLGRQPERVAGAPAPWAAAHSGAMMDVNSSDRPDLYGHLRSFLLPEVGRGLPDLSPDGAGLVAGSWAPHLLRGVPEVTASPVPSWDASPDNASGCGEQINYGRVEKVVIGSILTLITLLTIAGNCLVVISVCFVKKLRQPSNYLIVSLALADLSVAVAVMPFVSVTDLIGGKWIFGHFFCNVFIAMDVMCCTASIMTLCVISIDR